jgi:hypothetical protein
VVLMGPASRAVTILQPTSNSSSSSSSIDGQSGLVCTNLCRANFACLSQHLQYAC